jgi:4-amino-4-deoxy-L-arabinose transferase-like glycosyltransferase
LRLPSLFYTWAIALMVGLLTWRIARADPANKAAMHPVTTGAIAALVYLSFFTTYRYGRPCMTSAPETFWLCRIFLAMAWSPAALLASKWKFPLLAALALGIGCLYKSFAMVVPVGFGLALCYQVVGANRAPWAVVRPGIFFDALRVAAICGLGLGIFGLWFVVGPLPGEVWQAVWVTGWAANAPVVAVKNNSDSGNQHAGQRRKCPRNTRQTPGFKAFLG